MMIRLVVRGIVLAVTGVILAACVGLGGEPAIISTRLPAPTPTPTTVAPPVFDLGYPASVPDLTNGGRIYAQHCAACHGDSGAGDGPVALNAGLAPGSFLEPASARAQTPHEWFSTITNGRIENLMPPWKDALSEQDRWDVAMYTYTLHVSDDSLALGQSLYQECAECHGSLGVGDGPEATRLGGRVKDLTDQSAMVTLSDGTMYNMVTQGFEDIMPSYADRFSDDERWAVVAYARSLSLTASGTPLTADDGSIEVTGTVTLFGSDDLPDGLSVRLLVFNPQTGEPAELGLVMPAPVDADGMYRFSDIPYDPALAYFASVLYEGYSFASAPAQHVDESGALRLDIVIYEVSTAPTDGVVTAWVNQITVYDGWLDVISVMQIQNLSESAMVSSGEFLPDGRPIAFRLPLPDGAQPDSPDASGLVLSEDGLTFIDTQPLPPRGQKLLTARYRLPYVSGQAFSFPHDLTVAGVVRILVHPLEVRVEAESLPPLGEEFIGGLFYKAYGDQLALRGDSTLDFVLSGVGLPADSAPTPAPTAAAEAPSRGGDPAAAVTSEVLTPILAVIGLGVVALTVWLMVRRPKRRA